MPAEEQVEEKLTVMDRLYISARRIWWYLFKPPLKLREDEYERLVDWYLDLVPPRLNEEEDDKLSGKIADYLDNVEPPKYIDHGGYIENPPATTPNPFSLKPTGPSATTKLEWVEKWLAGFKYANEVVTIAQIQNVLETGSPTGSIQFEDTNTYVPPLVKTTKSTLEE